MTDISTKLRITKLLAAQRQLRAAIRMFFLEEDELAIHTVASAAYSMLTNLKSKCGRNEAADSHLIAVFYSIRDYRRGKLPSYLSDDPAIMKWITEMAEQLPIEADMHFDEIKASVSPETTRRFWDKRNKIANFLKHADRDSNSSIVLDEVDNMQLIMQACAAHITLAPYSGLGSEGLIFWLYYSIESGMSESLPEMFSPLVEQIENMSQAERLVFCSHLVQEFADIYSSAS